jgi:hypothetical protein
VRACFPLTTKQYQVCIHLTEKQIYVFISDILNVMHYKVLKNENDFKRFISTFMNGLFNETDKNPLKQFFQASKPHCK